MKNIKNYKGIVGYNHNNYKLNATFMLYSVLRSTNIGMVFT